MSECNGCSREINTGDKFGKIGFYTNDTFDGYGIYCYSCSVYLIKDFEKNGKCETYKEQS